ncbi:MAG: phosphonate ABC transporter, permease protein PhnE [Pseudomonadota bacterium]
MPLPVTVESFCHAEQSARMARLRRAFAGLVALSAMIAFSAHVGQFDLARLTAGLPKITDFLSGLVPPLRWSTLGTDLAAWYWGWAKWLALLWTTILMALFGTAAGTVLGALLSFLAARNLGWSSPVIFLVRRVLEIARTVPDLVWALVFLFAFGLGPLAGVLAIALHTIGAQGKLFAEANENVDMQPLEGVRSAGGSWLDEIMIGLVPQVLPNYVSYSLWRFEINVRSATIIGFVGAGGIGMELYDSLSLNYFDDAGAILLIVLATVTLIDLISEWARSQLAGLNTAEAR